MALDVAQEPDELKQLLDALYAAPNALRVLIKKVHGSPDAGSRAAVERGGAPEKSPRRHFLELADARAELALRASHEAVEGVSRLLRLPALTFMPGPVVRAGVESAGVALWLMDAGINAEGNYPFDVGSPTGYSVARQRIKRSAGGRIMRVPQQVRDCVAFLYDANDSLLGTGFFVGVPDEEHRGQSFPYLFTAKHVIRGHSQIKIRYNAKGGGTETGMTNTIDGWWEAESDSIDLACVHFCPADLQVTMIRPDQIADHAFFIQEDVGPGDEIVFSSLFVRTPGQSRNLPINRFGQIVRMNEETVSQQSKNRQGESVAIELDAVLVETHSWGGQSGSPAFVVFPMTRYMGQLRGVGDSPRDNWALLGVLSGHWDLPSPIVMLNTNKRDKERDAQVNSGIALVVPGQHLLDMLFQREDVVKHREDLKKQERINKAATADSDIPEHEHGPFNRNDFENALRRVSRRSKPSQPDEASSGT